MRVLIILGGDAPERELTEACFRWADRVICTDSGADCLAGWRLWPHLLVGDMDSVSPQALLAMEQAQVPMERHDPHKDLTDGQLACLLAADGGADEVTVLGGWGGRADHSFANLMLLRYLGERGIGARMACPGQWVRLLGPGEHTLEGPVGGTFSLLPFCDGAALSRISGAEYPLDRSIPLPLGMSMELPLCISNRLTGERAQVTVDSGWVLCFLPR